MKTATTLTEFREMFPARQATHTGLWGWRRVNGCVDLNCCIFDSRGEAEADRDRAENLREYDAGYLSR